MQQNPDQHDPGWSRYPETILHFSGDFRRVEIDLRTAVTPETLSGLERLGLREPFAVITAFNPFGENLPREENDRLAAKLDQRLRESGHEFTRVDACSPDGSHCEDSVAVKMPKKDAMKLAAELEQVAIFWFDGGQFWIVAALVDAEPIRLPRSS